MMPSPQVEKVIQKMGRTYAQLQYIILIFIVYICILWVWQKIQYPYIYIYMLFIVISSYFINTLNHSVAVEQRYIYIYIRTLHISQVMMSEKSTYSDTVLIHIRMLHCSDINGCRCEWQFNLVQYNGYSTTPPVKSPPKSNKWWSQSTFRGCWWLINSYKRN